MSFQNFFPIWDQLQPHQQRQLLDSLTFQTVKRGAIVRGGNADCAGLLLIRTGQLRAPCILGRRAGNHHLSPV